MTICSEFSFLSTNGKTELHGMEWRPDVGIRGIVQIAHGMCDHIRRYDEFARFLADNGFVVVGHDHIGHGESAKSSDELGYCGEFGGWEIMTADIRKLHELIRERYASVPYFLFGHSMGSFLARTYITHYKKDLAGVIICGTAHQQKAVVAIGKAIVAAEHSKNGGTARSQRLHKLTFGGYNSAFKGARTDFDWISSDHSMVDKYIADPFCGYMISNALSHEVADAISFITNIRNIRRINSDLPVYFISGEKDPVGENGKGVIRAYRSYIDAGIKDVSMKLYPGKRHEILNESNRLEVYSDIVKWIDFRL